MRFERIQKLCASNCLLRLYSHVGSERVAARECVVGSDLAFCGRPKAYWLRPDELDLVTARHSAGEHPRCVQRAELKVGAQHRDAAHRSERLASTLSYQARISRRN